MNRGTVKRDFGGKEKKERTKKTKGMRKGRTGMLSQGERSLGEKER
jgi:hypothetical protein